MRNGGFKFKYYTKARLGGVRDSSPRLSTKYRALRTTFYCIHPEH